MANYFCQNHPSDELSKEGERHSTRTQSFPQKRQNLTIDETISRDGISAIEIHQERPLKRKMKIILFDKL